MILNYYDISYETAKEFLNSLSDDKIGELFDKYNTKDIEELTAIISDQDLYNLGFQHVESENVHASEYMYNNVYDIENFLNSLDIDIIEDLKKKYYAYNVEDLAVAITDDDLEKLKYQNTDIKDAEAVSDVSDVNVFEYNCYTIDESMEYLEDVPSDIEFAVIDENNNIFAVKDDIAFERFTSNLDRNLVDYCEKVDSNSEEDSIYFQIIPHSYNVSEDVVINDKLNPIIFDDEHHMLSDVRDKLESYYNLLLSYLKNKGIELEVDDVTLIGSNAGYLYLPESDIDLHLITSPIDVDVFEMLKDEFDLFEAEHPLLIGDSNVEIGIEDNYNTIMNVKNPRRYSILTDEWVDNSDENEIYNKDDVSLVDGYEEIVNEYTDRIDDVINSDEYIDALELKAEIRQNRSNDLAEKGALSMGNVVFKELRNNGAYGRLKDYLRSKETQQDENMYVSIEEDVKSDKAKNYYINRAYNNSDLESALDLVSKYDKELYNHYSAWAEKSSIDDYTLTNDRKLDHLRDLIHDKYYE